MKTLALILFASFCMVSSEAFAQSKAELSKIEKVELIKRIDAGEEAYENGDFERALREYTRAYEILPDPGFHYRIALANERLGNDEAALKEYRLYLEKRGQVERTIALLEQTIARKNRVLFTVGIEPELASVQIYDAASDALLVEGPAPLEAKLEPSRVRIVAKAEGHETLTRELELESGKDATISLELRPIEVSHGRSLVRPITATSVAVVTSAATVVSLLLYSSASDDLETIRGTPRDFSRTDAEDAASDANLFQTLSWAFGAASVVTISWAVYEWTRDGEDSAEVETSFMLTPIGPAARVSW